MGLYNNKKIIEYRDQTEGILGILSDYSYKEVINAEEKERFLKALSSVESLCIGGSYFHFRHATSAFVELVFQLKNLKYLDMSYLRIEGDDISILGPSELECLLATYSGLCKLPDNIGNLKSLKYLDISASNITTLSNSIGELTNLEALDLSFNEIQQLPSEFIKLTKLSSLDLSGTELERLPDGFFDNLNGLECLNLNNTKLEELSPLISGLKFLKKIGWGNSSLVRLPVECLMLVPQLEYLDISNTNLKTLPENLNVLLPNLKGINLENTCLSAEDTRIISKLKELKYLNLKNTRIKSIDASISSLRNLEYLDVSKTMICSIPDSISELCKLKELYLNETNLEVLPSSLCALSNLEVLELEYTKVKCLPLEIGNLVKLKKLRISSTPIESLPDSMRRLSNLEWLYVEDMTLIELPPFVLDYNLNFISSYHGYPYNLKGIFIDGLALKDQPIEIFRRSRELIIEYYKSTKAEATSPINECKVVFLGDGGAGKSLIIERLMNDGKINSDFKGESTPGICISSKKYLIGDEEIELHFWDFGGQEIMHSMHRLFLTNRTLYVVVSNARDNKANEQAWYWIRNIKSFANNAPVLLLVNQKDQNPSANVNENGLRKEYAELKEVRIVSALKDSKEEFDRDIRDVICQIVSGMETVRAPFPRPWLALMDDLQDMQEDYITSEAFYTKCSNNNVDSKPDILDQIIGWYQDLGVCFYSKANLYAERYMVLKPRWLLNAIYILAFNGRKYAQNGIIREKDLFALVCKPGDAVKKVWSDIEYRPDEIQYIVYVLMNYELIYRLDYERFFVPMLCDDNEPRKMDFVDSEEAFHVSYEYMYLPENVLHLLMVRHGYELNTDMVWRTGAVFERRQLGWSSLVRIKENCLDIYAKSDDQNVHPVNSYLDIMRESIGKVNEKLGIEATEYIAYRKDGVEDRFKYKTLVGSKKTGISEVYSEAFDRAISIDDVLGIIKCSDKLSDSDPNYQIDALLSSVMDALGKMQGNCAYYNAKEDTCNSYIRDLLEFRGYTCKDQTLHGTSGTGKSDGELDILIRDKDRGIDLAIYEALKLSAFGDSAKENLIMHLEKLLKNYNPTGITNLFLVSYVSWSRDRFKAIADEYGEFIKRNVGAEFLYKKIRSMDLYSSSLSRCLKVVYDCGGTEMNVYHVIVRVAK